MDRQMIKVYSTTFLMILLSTFSFRHFCFSTISFSTSCFLSFCLSTLSLSTFNHLFHENIQLFRSITMVILLDRLLHAFIHCYSYMSLFSDNIHYIYLIYSTTGYFHATRSRISRKRNWVS